jgi:hypothetical protein
MPKRYFAVCVIVLLVSLSLLFMPATTMAQNDDGTAASIREKMASIRTGLTSEARTAAAKQLFEITRRHASRHVDRKSLLDIASLLDTEEDSVRYWVAMTLGNFGPRAKFAVPRLVAVLTQVDCSHASKTSASGIRVALRKIGVHNPPSKCE